MLAEGDQGGPDRRCNSICLPVLVSTNDHNPVVRSRGAIDSDDLSNIEPEIGAFGGSTDNTVLAP